MSGMTETWQRDLLAGCLDDWGHPTEAANVRNGEDLESYESDFRLLQKLADYGLLDAARLRGEAQAQYSDFISDGGMDPRNQQAGTPAPVAGDAVAKLQDEAIAALSAECRAHALKRAKESAVYFDHTSTLLMAAADALAQDLTNKKGT